LLACAINAHETEARVTLRLVGQTSLEVLLIVISGVGT